MDPRLLRIPSLTSLRAAVATFVALAVPDAHAAQTTLDVSSRLSCEKCRIGLTRVATLGDASGPGAVQQQGGVVMDSRGRYLVTSNFDAGRVKVFDSRGVYRRDLGRPGKGPGEFTGRPLLFPVADSIVAFDLSLRRITVFGPDLNAIRSFGFQGFLSAISRAPAGRLFVAANVATRSRIGLPLHLVDSGGHLVRSFGQVDGKVDASDPLSAVRIIAEGSGGRIWTARLNAYQLESWDSSGELRRRVQRHTDWFVPWARANGIQGLVRQPPSTVGLQERGLDSLWVLIRVDDADWKIRPPTPVKGTDASRTSDADKELIYDTIIEIVDAGRGRLVLSQRFAQNIIGFVSRDRVASYEEDAQGIPRYVIWQLTLHVPKT